MLQYVKAVLNFSAFRPEPDDPVFSWKSRFSGRKTALINLGRNSFSYTLLDGSGQIEEGETRQGDAKELFAEIGPTIKSETVEAACMISLNSRFVISIESNLSRKKGSEEAIKRDPRSVLHARFERGKVYTVTHNPETNSSLLLTIDDENIKKTQALAQAAGLKVGRICCGTYVLLRHALSLTNTKKGSETSFSALYLICCRGSVCALLQEKDNWVELRSRPDLFEAEGDLDPLMELLAPLVERLGPDHPLVLLCDEPALGLVEKLAEVYPQRALTDLTQTGLLAEILYQN